MIEIDSIRNLYLASKLVVSKLKENEVIQHEMFSFDVNTRYDDNVSKMYNFAKTGQLESFKQLTYNI